MFFGLFCFGSVFYMWSLSSAGEMTQRIEEIYRTAAAQRYYLLAHAAFVHGILVFTGYRRSGEWSVEVHMPMSKLFLYAAGASFALAYLMNMLPGLGQFAGKFQYLTVAAAILGTAYAIRNGYLSMVAIGSGIYGYMCVVAVLSGWKSKIILLVGLLLLALYPHYKKSVLVVGAGAAVVFATLLPAYNGVFRQLSWRGEQSAQQAAQVAISRVMSGEVDVRRESWRFLRNRLTTVSLFTDYIRSTPSRHSYLGLATTKQALYAIIPRVLWPGKPNTEELVMQRVFERSQSIRRFSQVSAKPTVVVDGYLAAGGLGVWLACFLLGGIASIASRYAERWFGGYVIGGQLVYTGLFARILFATSFEFLLNALFWSFVLMAVLAYGLQFLGWVRWAERRAPSTSVTQTRLSATQ
jgi:hypothetical protein